MAETNSRTDLERAGIRIRAGANPLEIACVNGLQAADPSCVYNFVRTFQHRDSMSDYTRSRQTSTRSATTYAAPLCVSRRCARS